MDTVIVASSQFYSHYPKRIPQGTVNAEAVLIRLDSEWDGLPVRIHWLNVASGVEKVVLLERDKPNTIPWEVLTDLGELRMGLVGMDGDTVIKPTIWLSYGYVSDGVDPESGSDPQPPTPSWEQQMVAQATQANQAAQEAKGYAQQVAESIESAGPYAEEAKEAAEAAKTSETAAKGAADTATQQATKAQEAVASIGDAVQQAQQAATDAGAAKSAAEIAQAAAAQSAGTAQNAATTASQAAQSSQDAATQAGQYLASVEADAQAAANAATAAGKSQEAAQTAAQEAGNARDQANTAAITAQDHATAADTSKTAAEQAATTAGNAQAGAAQSAQKAAGYVGQTSQAAQEAKNAAQAAATAQTGAEEAESAAHGHAQDADTARTQAQTAATEAERAKSQAETAEKNAEEYAQQALASVLPNAADVPDDYVLKTSGGLPVWGELSDGGLKFELVARAESDGEATMFKQTFDPVEPGIYVAMGFFGKDTAQNKGQSLFCSVGEKVSISSQKEMRFIGSLSRADDFSQWGNVIFVYDGVTIRPLSAVYAQNTGVSEVGQNGAYRSTQVASVKELAVYSQVGKNVPAGSFCELYKIGGIQV